MWNDIETTKDTLNFSVVAETAAELIIESDGQPISIGVSGNWGVGKSSMVKMIGEAIKNKSKENTTDKKYIFLEFNAWLYQGYDDARTALLQAVTDKLLKEAKEHEGILEKVKSFAKRINWLQMAKIAVPMSVGLLPGGVAVGGLAALTSAISNLWGSSDSENEAENSKKLHEAFKNLAPELKGMLKENASKTMPQQIEELRNEFEKLLSEMKVTLVVLVDDLDRCLPATAISTLEAMRLLLFVEHTAFIIAADAQMIRSSVKAHFSEIDMNDGLVTSYFDKLIQIPLSIPRLGIAEVKIYIISLFTELALRKGEISAESHSSVTAVLQSLLRNAWQGGISKHKLESAFQEDDISKMRSYIDIAEQLSGILVTANSISGNPRLIKRFLNELMIREKVAKSNGMTIEFSSLVKMLLFERCSKPNSLEYLIERVTESENGILVFLDEIETALSSGNDYKEPDESWSDPFVKEWVKLEPKFGKKDLRPLLYLSRDKSPVLAAYDELTKEAKEILLALETVDKSEIKEIVTGLKNIGEIEAEKILVRICNEGQAKQWDIKVLRKALHVTAAYPNLGSRLADFLKKIAVKSLIPAYIPLLRDKGWASEILATWSSDTSTPSRVKNAINERGK